MSYFLKVVYTGLLSVLAIILVSPRAYTVENGTYPYSICGEKGVDFWLEYGEGKSAMWFPEADFGFGVHVTPLEQGKFSFEISEVHKATFDKTASVSVPACTVSNDGNCIENQGFGPFYLFSNWLENKKAYSYIVTSSTGQLLEAAWYSLASNETYVELRNHAQIRYCALEEGFPLFYTE